MGFLAENDYEVAVRVMERVKFVPGPVDRPDSGFGHLDLGTPGLKLVELIRVDSSEGITFQRSYQVAGGVGRGIAGIAPTGERQHRHRAAQFRMADPFEMRTCRHPIRSQGQRGMATGGVSVGGKLHVPAIDTKPKSWLR